MKNSFLILAILLGAMCFAQAGTITITITTAGAPCNNGLCTKTYTDTDANLAKIALAYAAGCQSQNLQPVGNPPIQTPTACTTLQTLLYWFNGLMAGTAAN